MKPSLHRDTSVTKVDSSHSPRGAMGQKYLAAGVSLSMRLWEDEPPGELSGESERDYEVVGYVLRGRAELHLEGQVVVLAPGDCYVVPRQTRHAYRVLETFTAVEATHPPSHLHDRDQPQPQRQPS
jgi:quercetin dioxygenase-like cupin family protein